MWKRLLLIRGAELLLFAVLAAIPLFVRNPYAVGLLVYPVIYEFWRGRQVKREAA